MGKFRTREDALMPIEAAMCVVSPELKMELGRIPVNQEYCCLLLLSLSLFALLLPGDCLFQGAGKDFFSHGKFGFKQPLARLIPKTQHTSKPR